MANKAAADGAAKPNGIFITTGVYTDEPLKGLRWGELSYEGVTYRIRQTTVAEGDDNYDAAYDEQTQKFNGRLNSRLNLSSSLVTPSTSIDDMSRWSGHKLVTLLKAWDELNIVKEADAAGNS